MKKLLFIPIALILLALPMALRWVYLYEGTYVPKEVPRPDLSSIQVPTPEMPQYVDSYQPGNPGVILVDVAHKNHFQMSDLSVLQARLAARGQRVEALTNVDNLARQLRYAKALVIVSPRVDWTAAEVQAVRTFVDKGGRLLLITDATHFDILYDELGDFTGLDHDVAHVNDLAAQFGLIFQADYLYNTVENESNYRNIRLTEMEAGPLTQGLKQVIFYGSRSITSQEKALIITSGETRSSSNEAIKRPAVAVLAAGGDVLAVGDLTFMSEPYNAVADNNRLTSNIADFLSGAQRQYALSDLPFFFADEVDLVYISDPLLNDDLLPAGGMLQRLFAERSKQLTLRQDEDEDHDTLFLGLYDRAAEVESYLTAAGITLWISPTEEPALSVVEGSGEGPKATSTSGITLTRESSSEVESRIEIQSVGEMAMTGTALLVLQEDGERNVLIVLAHSVDGLQNAVTRLADGNLVDCVLRETSAPSRTALALCPTSETEPGEDKGGWVPSDSKEAASSITRTPTLTEKRRFGGSSPEAIRASATRGSNMLLGSAGSILAPGAPATRALEESASAGWWLAL